MEGGGSEDTSLFGVELGLRTSQSWNSSWGSGSVGTKLDKLDRLGINTNKLVIDKISRHVLGQTEHNLRHLVGLELEMELQRIGVKQNIQGSRTSLCQT